MTEENRERTTAIFDLEAFDPYFGGGCAAGGCSLSGSGIMIPLSI